MKKNTPLFKTFRFWVSFVAVLYFISTIFIIPSVIKNQTVNFLNNNLKQNSSLERVSFNPFGFEVQFYNFKLYDKKNDLLLDFEKIRVDFDLIKTAISQVVNFDAITLYKPTINVKLLKDGNINLLELVPKSSTEEKVVQKEEINKSDKIFPINFNEIKLEKTEIFFTDLRDEKPFKVNIFPLDFSFINLSTQVEEKGTYDFDIVVNKHTKLEGKGFIALNPVNIEGNIFLSKLHVGDYWPKVEKDFKFYINDALFDLNSKYKVTMLNNNLEIKLNNTDATLSNLKLGSKKENRDLITLDLFKTSNLSLSWPSQDVTIEKIDFKSFYTDLVIHKNIRTNIAELFQKKVANDKVKEETKESKETEETKPWNVNVTALKMGDSKVDITDLSKTKPFKTVLNQIDYEFKNLSTKNNGIQNQNLFIQINNHTNVNINGSVEFEPLKLKGTAKIQNIQTNDFWSHIQDELKFDLYDTKVDISTQYFVDVQKELDVILENLNLNIDNLNMRAKNSKKNIISLKNTKTNLSKFDLKNQDIKIDNITLDRLYTNFVLNKDKTNNIEPLFISKDTKKSNVKKSATKQTNKKDKSWKVSIKNVDLKKSKISVKDKSTKKPFTTSLNNINLNVKNIDLEPKTKFSYKLNSKIGKKAKLKSIGKISINPLSLNTSYSLNRLPLGMFQPYIDETLNINLQSADFYTKGQFKLKPKTNHISLYANSSLRNINIKQKQNSESLVKVSRVNINKLNFSQKKNSLKIKSVDLIKPYAKVHIDENKKTNFNDLVKKSDTKEIKKVETKKADVKKEKKADALLFDLGPINIKNGSMNFTDLSLPLPFKSFIESLEGKVSELSSYSSKPSDILIDGVIDKYGLAKINGSLDYKNINENTQINMLFKNIATKNLTPYSSEFIGRKIDGGKLTLDLNYKIIESKLDASNKIIINKIQLGDKIESENSISVPIDLAIALLEDSNGIIDLSLPVTGNVDDPKFQIGSVVGQAFANLIIKMVTSPFTFLGSLLGVEEDKIKFVDFEAGKFELLPPAKENLDILVKALKTRPSLALELEKTYNTSVDTQAIKISKFEAALNKKILELKKVTKDKKVDTYMVALELMYLNSFTKEKLKLLKKSFIKKIKDKKVFEKTPYLNHLKSKQIQAQVVTKKELETLATTRSAQVSLYLNKEHNIELNRVVVKDFKILEGNKDNQWIKSELGITVKQK